MWKANIKSITGEVNNSIAVVTFEYVHSDGRKKSVQERISDPTSVKQIALNGVKELERVDSINDLVSNPPLGEIVLSAPEQTEEELSTIEYQKKKSKLVSLKEELDINLITKEEYLLKVADIKNR